MTQEDFDRYEPTLKYAPEGLTHGELQMLAQGWRERALAAEAELSRLRASVAEEESDAR